MADQPFLLTVTASRLPALLVLLGCLALAAGVAVRLATAGSGFPARRLLVLMQVCLALGAGWAAFRLAKPKVVLSVTQSGLYLTQLPAEAVPPAEGGDAPAVFLPWQAVESIALERVEEYDGRRGRPRDVLAFTLRPAFESLRAAGIVVTPGVRRSTLDYPVPSQESGPPLLAKLRALHQRFSR